MSARSSTLTLPESSTPIEKRNLVAAVAYALWEDRKRQLLPADPEADWYSAERLIEDLWVHRPPDDL
jgi:hypothetical protein